MAENLDKWPSERGPISKIMPSDGCGRDTVPLAVGRWYDFHGFGCHLGNVGLNLAKAFWPRSFLRRFGRNLGLYLLIEAVR